MINGNGKNTIKITYLKKDRHLYLNQKIAWVAVLISEKLEFKVKIILRQRVIKYGK